MSLRKNTLVSITITTLLLIVVLLWLSSRILLGSFSRLEEQNIRQNAQQTVRLLEDEIAKLQSTLRDWSSWDDTYRFVTDRNAPYIENNLNDASLVNLNVNFMVFTDTAGQIVYAKAVDLEAEAGAALPEALRAHIENSIRLNRIEDEATVGGIVLLPDVPVLIASAPVLNSLEEGPPRGRMILGRYFDASQIKQMAEKLQLSLSLHRFDRGHLSEKLRHVAESFRRGRQVIINKLNDDHIEIFFLIKDIYDAPILFMGIDKSRSIYVQGRNTLAYFTSFLIASGVVFMFVTAALMEKMVLSRLRRVTRQVKAIESQGDFNGRLSLDGSDELARLGCDLNRMLDALQASTERDRNILDTILDGYCETDLQGHILMTNQSLCGMSGYGEAELLRMRIDDFIHPQDAARIRQTIRASRDRGIPVGRLSGMFQAKNGRTGHFDAAVNQIIDNQGRTTGYRGIIRDVSEQKKNEARLVYLAYHDPLTGLYNRKAFLQQLDKEIAYARRYGQKRVLLFIDLDKFKAVNDTLGHVAGDLLLAEVAKRLQAQLRQTDVIARVGGDEFTVLLTSPEGIAVDTVVERIAASLRAPFDLNGEPVTFVSASVGVKRFPADAETAEELIKAADRDMYQAKTARKHTKIRALIDRHRCPQMA